MRKEFSIPENVKMGKRIKLGFSNLIHAVNSDEKLWKSYLYINLIRNMIKYCFKTVLLNQKYELQLFSRILQVPKT